MARRRGRRGANGRRRAEGQPQPSAAIDRLDGCTLAVVADFCSLRDCCALRHRVSKRTSQQLASADESEVFARARVLQRMAEWWQVTLWSDVAEYVPVPEQSEGNPLSCHTRKGNLNHIWHQLRVLLRARYVRTLRLGGLQAFCQYAVVAMCRLMYNCDLESTLERELMEFPVRPGSLESLDNLEDTRKYVLRLIDSRPTSRPALKQFYLLFFHCQRFSEFLALDKALRRGTQRPRGCLVGPWRFLEQSLSRDYCPCCDRFRNQRRPEFHFRTTRRGEDKCPSCDMIGWADALKRYRLTREQLPRGSVTWNRKLTTKSGFFRVPMVPRSRAEAVARQVWGDDWERRIARARTRAHKKKRRRQRDAVAKRKSYNEAKSRSIKAALTAAAIAGRDAADGRSVAVRTRGRQQERDDNDSDATADMPPQVGDAYSTAFEASMRSQGYPHFTYWSRKLGGTRGDIPQLSGYHIALANRAKVIYGLNGYMSHVTTKAGRIFR